MNLGQTRIGFPVLQIQATVFHATPRSPTAIERVVLRLCDQFGSNPSYNNISMERVFEDILCVADPAPILVPTLQELVMLDVLRCRSDYSAIDRLAIRDLEITDRGRQMLVDDMLPARPQENDETYYFDPIRKRLLSGSEGKLLRPAASPIALDADGFREVFPEDQIRESIPRGSYSWWSPASRIERIERRSATMLWREVPAQITLEQEEVKILLKDTDYTEYLAGLAAQELFERVLSPALLGDGSLVAGFTAFPTCRLSDFDGKGEWLTFPQAIADCQASSRVWCVDGDGEAIGLPDEPGKRQAFIRFGASPASGSTNVRWNADRNGCEVNVAGTSLLDGIWLATDKHRLFARRVQLRVGRDSWEVPLVCRAVWPDGSGGVSGLLAPLGEMLRSDGRGGDVFAPALWASEPDFWRDHCQHVLSEPHRLPESLDLMLQAKEAFVRITGAIQPSIWDAVVRQAIEVRLSDGSDKVGATELDAMMTAVAKCEPITAPTATSISKQVFDRLLPPAELDEFGKVAAAFRRGGPLWKIPYPSHLYNASVLTGIFRGFGGDVISGSLQNDNAFEQAIRRLDEGYRAINEAVGPAGISSLTSEEARVGLLKTKNATLIAEHAVTWYSRYESFSQAFPELRPHVQGSPLASLGEVIGHVAALMRKLVAGLDPRFRFVFVLDTSAILDRPALLGSVRADEYVVVSKRVIEELDDKKLDEGLRPKVAQATRSLTDFPKLQVQFCDGDMSLLPPDYRLKGDNLILSVAVKYRRYAPTLVTNDNNLALKAKAEGIGTMNAEQFEQRPRAKAVPPSAANGPSRGSKNPNPKQAKKPRR